MPRPLSRALVLNPNQADALHWQAGLLRASGRLREELAVRRRVGRDRPAQRGLLPEQRSPGKRQADPFSAGRDGALAARVSRQSAKFRGTDLIDAGHLAEAQVPAARALALQSNWAPGMNAGMYSALGDFEKVLAAGRPEGAGLTALGRNEEAVAVARERFAAAPEDHGCPGLTRSLSWAGRFDEVLALPGSAGVT